ncbi:hypothetical protein QYB59_001549 [Clostridium perfringens]|nr:hypothetical protein [Clostridium perfringens]
MFEDLKNYILKDLQKKVKENNLKNYKTFGNNIEDLVSDLIEEYLKKNKVEYEAKRAKNKNEFPDLKLTIGDTVFAFEHKAGASDKGPANDLGTLKAYTKKIKEFNDNIFCVFVKYSKAQSNKGIIIEDVYLDKIYKFIGKRANEEDILKYRKKDGNLRPKTWKEFEDNIVYFKNLNEFKKAIKKTNIYRSEEIIKEHINSLDNASLNKIKDIINKKIK